MDNILIIPAVLDKLTTLKDKTIKLTFESNELTPDELGSIATYLQQFGYLAFKKDMFKADEKELLKSLETEYKETGKSKSQRLRAVLYKNFEQENLRYEVFDDYYNYQMETLIKHFKSKLK